MTNPVDKFTSYDQFLVSRELGGAGLIGLHLARFVRDRGGDSRVWVPGTGPARAEAERLGLPATEFNPAPAFGPSAVRTAMVNWGLWRELANTRPGLVHVHSPGLYGVLRHGLRHSGLKRVVHVHLEEDEQGLRWALKSPPDLIITCAQFLVDQVRRVLPEAARERQRIAAVPNAVDTAKFSPGDKGEAKRKVGAPPGVLLAVMLANLAAHKGQETAVRAAAALKARGVEAHFWLAGTERGSAGSFTARLQALVHEMGVADRVRLLGQRGDAPDLLRAADFFLLPSTCEGLPLSILEAQATKIPVLAAPTAGVPEVVCDGETGFLIEADDAAGYADRIERLVSHPDLRGRVAEAAYDKVRREHNWPAYCQRVWNLYQAVLHGPSASRGGWSFFRASQRHPVPATRTVRSG